MEVLAERPTDVCGLARLFEDRFRLAALAAIALVAPPGRHGGSSRGGRRGLVSGD